ncbi:hypothetical protein SERLA73DRAFT_157536, partial [Serpula lacrymans var. lacrymans S7.3]
EHTIKVVEDGEWVPLGLQQWLDDVIGPSPYGQLHCVFIISLGPNSYPDVTGLLSSQFLPNWRTQVHNLVRGMQNGKGRMIAERGIVSKNEDGVFWMKVVMVLIGEDGTLGQACVSLEALTDVHEVAAWCLIRRDKMPDLIVWRDIVLLWPLLNVWDDDEPILHTFADDLESFFWVILCVLLSIGAERNSLTDIIPLMNKATMAVDELNSDNLVLACAHLSPVERQIALAEYQDELQPLDIVFTMPDSMKMYIDKNSFITIICPTLSAYKKNNGQDRLLMVKNSSLILQDSVLKMTCRIKLRNNTQLQHQVQVRITNSIGKEDPTYSNKNVEALDILALSHKILKLKFYGKSLTIN